jgi:hypothetical protein
MTAWHYERLCSMCRRWLSSAEFRPHLLGRDGLHPWCRACCAAKQREWRAANPERVAAYNESRRKPLVELECVECGEKFEGRPHAKLCSRRCKDKRYRRLHPEQVRAKEQRKRERRRERMAA